MEQEAGCGWGDLHLSHLALKGCHFSGQVCASVNVRATAAHCWMETMKDAFTLQSLKITSAKKKEEKPWRHNFTKLPSCDKNTLVARLRVHQKHCKCVRHSGNVCVCESARVFVHAFKRISQRLNYFQTTESVALSRIPRTKSTNLLHQVQSD